jgi:hypothetical protein
MADKSAGATSINWKETKHQPDLTRKPITIPSSPISLSSANNEVEKMKNASPLALNLGPGVTPLGQDTFKLLRLNGMNKFAI